MIYSYTQISQYLSCPRRYKHRYLDGWKEKDTRAAMVFGRAFEQAVAAYFQRQDAAAVLCREWSTHRETGLRYSEGDSWDHMLQSGVQLLDRFAQDGRIHICQPRSQFTGQVHQGPVRAERLRGLRGCHRGTRWHPLPARMEDHLQPLSRRTLRIARSRSSAGLLFLGRWHRGRGPSGVCPQAVGIFGSQGSVNSADRRPFLLVRQERYADQDFQSDGLAVELCRLESPMS